MTSPEQRTGLAQIVVQMPTEGPRPSAVPANFFHFAHAGVEITMSVGLVDPNDVVNAAATSNGKALDVEVTHRFFMSLSGFQFLRTQVDEIGKSLDQMRLSAPRVLDKERK